MKGKMPPVLIAKMTSKMGMSKSKPDMMDDELGEGELPMMPMKAKVHKMPNGKMMRDTEMQKPKSKPKKGKKK